MKLKLRWGKCINSRPLKAAKWTRTCTDCKKNIFISTFHTNKRTQDVRLHGFCHLKLVFDDRFNAFITVTCLFHRSYARNSAGYTSQGRAHKSPIVGAERSGQSTISQQNTPPIFPYHKCLFIKRYVLMRRIQSSTQHWGLQSNFCFPQSWAMFSVTVLLLAAVSELTLIKK